MSRETVVVQPVGIGFCGLLAIVFITLKLCGVVAWSWLWVLSPLWIPFAIFFAVFGCILLLGLLGLILAGIVALFKN